MVSTVVTSRSPVTRYLPEGSGNTGGSMTRPCSSTHQFGPSSFHPAGATPPACFNRSKLCRRTPLGPGSTGHNPHVCAPLPELASGLPSAAMNCGEMRSNFIRPLGRRQPEPLPCQELPVAALLLPDLQGADPRGVLFTVQLGFTQVDVARDGVIAHHEYLQLGKGE